MNSGFRLVLPCFFRTAQVEELRVDAKESVVREAQARNEALTVTDALATRLHVAEDARITVEKELEVPPSRLEYFCSCFAW
jgi:hypothetical protein